MGTTHMSVVIASEDSVLRGQLAQAVERYPGVQVAGQAKNAIEAVACARSLRPDMVVVDARLPYVVGLDDVRMSRASGLDTAMHIVEELQQGTVVVFNRDAGHVASAHEVGTEQTAVLWHCSRQVCSPIDLAGLHAEGAKARLVFADVQIMRRKLGRLGAAEIGRKMILFGGLGIAGGMALMLTFMFAPAGVALMSLGAVSALGGLITKVVARWRPVPAGANLGA